MGEAVRLLLLQAVPLYWPSPDRALVLMTDASIVGWGYALMSLSLDDKARLDAALRDASGPRGQGPDSDLGLAPDCLPQRAVYGCCVAVEYD